jgi:ADP-ribosylglycohydrolase
MGDALGYPIEFLDSAQITQRFGTMPPKTLDYDKQGLAQISDDTQMTLFTAEGLIRAKRRSDDRGFCDPRSIVFSALLRWYETQGGHPSRRSSERGWLLEEPRLHSRRAPGTTCMSALEVLAREASSPLPTVASPPNHSKGCGAVMRVAPCGLGAATREIAFELARDTGVITHGHPSGYLSAAYFAALVWDLARGGSLPAAMPHADALLSKERGADELQQILDRARTLAREGAPTVATIEGLGAGWTGEQALAIALLCALTFDPREPRAFEQALWRAAAHSGDSDSTAAITGNLLGAMLGADALPPGWLAALELRDVVERIACDLHAALIRGESLRAYPPN